MPNRTICVRSPADPNGPTDARICRIARIGYAYIYAYVSILIRRWIIQSLYVIEIIDRIRRYCSHISGPGFFWTGDPTGLLAGAAIEALGWFVQPVRCITATLACSD